MRSLAGGLVARGIADGDVVAILAPNQPEYAPSPVRSPNAVLRSVIHPARGTRDLGQVGRRGRSGVASTRIGRDDAIGSGSFIADRIRTPAPATSRSGSRGRRTRGRCRRPHGDAPRRELHGVSPCIEVTCTGSRSRRGPDTSSAAHGSALSYRLRSSCHDRWCSSRRHRAAHVQRRSVRRSLFGARRHESSSSMSEPSTSCSWAPASVISNPPNGGRSTRRSPRFSASTESWRSIPGSRTHGYRPITDPVVSELPDPGRPWIL